MASPLTREQVSATILAAIQRLNQSRPETAALPCHAEAPLYTDGSPLDSMGLVALLFDVEDELRELGWDGSLSDERAMSRTQSPFRSVPALVEFIMEDVRA